MGYHSRHKRKRGIYWWSFKLARNALRFRFGRGTCSLWTGRLSAGNNLPAILHLLRTTKAKQLGTSHSRPPSAVQIVPGERAQLHGPWTSSRPGPPAGKCKIMTTAFAVSQTQRSLSSNLDLAADSLPPLYAPLLLLFYPSFLLSVSTPVACPVLQVSKLTRNYCWLNFCGA